MYWDFYGLFGVGQFDSIAYEKKATYTVTIYKKNYRLTNQYNLPFGSNAAVLKYLSDDPFGVKGSELTLNLLNLDDGLPLSLFFAEEEDTFKVELKVEYESNQAIPPAVTTETLFTGYMVPEDSAEILSDIGHEIKLSFTDNLGTLKNIRFDEAAKFSPTSAANLRTISARVGASVESGAQGNRVQLFSNVNSGTPAVGDFVVLNDSPVGDVAYTIIKNTLASGIRTLEVREPVLGFAAVDNVKLAYVTGTNIYNRIKLADAVRICLHATNLNLSVFYAGSLKVKKESTEYSDWLNNTYIDGRTFQQDANNFKSCYDVLQSICERFRMSLFMSNNKWYLVRWDELRYYNDIIPGIVYNSYLVQQSTQNQTSVLNYGVGRIEAGMEQSLERPYNFYEENLDYKSEQAFYNQNLQILGAKTSSSVVTVDSVNYIHDEYEAEGWNTLTAGLGATFESRIRVVRLQSTNEETDRYLVVRYLTGTRADYPNVFRSKAVEINKGDRIKINFDVYEENPANTVGYVNRFHLDVVFGNGTNDFNYLSTGTEDETDYREFRQAPIVLSRAALPVGTGIISNEYETAGSLSDGLLYMYLGVDTVIRSPFPANDVRIYKNITLEIIPKTTNQTTIKGHQNKALVNRIVKNNETKAIILDDSTKNSVYGTLFLDAFQNLVQVRTKDWLQGSMFGSLKLGEITTRQAMDLKIVQRLKLEGKLLGVIDKETIINIVSFKHACLFNVIKIGVKNNLHFIFGKAEFNFREDFINVTLYEMWKDGETRSTPTSNGQIQFNFKYLYK